jgi:gliding motility-associated-like protein
MSLIPVRLLAQIKVQSLCAGSKGVLYYVNVDKGDTCYWSISKGGKIVSNPNNDTIWVDWGNNPEKDSISVYAKNPEGCLSDTMTLYINLKGTPIPYLGGNQSICKGQSFTFDAGSDFNTYIWQNGSKGRYFTTDSAQMVKVTVTNTDRCTGTDSALLTVNPLPIIQLPKDTMLCGDVPLILDAGYEGVSYLWSTHEISRTITVYPSPTDTTFWVTVEDNNGCSNSDSIKISKCNIDSVKNSIPIAFTPNGDNINDKWEIRRLAGYTKAVVEVFDRWGRRVFYEKGYSIPWDGTYNGKVLPMDSYLYIINLNEKNVNPFVGTVTILR